MSLNDLHYDYKSMDSSLVPARPSRKMIYLCLALGIVIIRHSYIFPWPRSYSFTDTFSRELYAVSSTSLPPSFKYDKKFTRQESGIIFYTFLNDKHEVSISNNR